MSRLLRAAPDLLALTALGLAAVLLHLQGLSGGPTYVERDTQLFYGPLTRWVGEQLQAGSFPLWTPAIFTGYPIFADGEMGLAYLPQVAALSFLPADLALVVLRTLHVFLAGAFMHLYLRTIRLGPLAALGGALVFAFGSFTTAQMHHENVVRSAIWLPLVLALVDRSLLSPAPRQRAGWVSASALAFAMAALGLHVQPVLMQAMAVAAWMLFRLLLGAPGVRAPRLKAVGLALVGTLAGGLALAAVQWGPLLEWALASFRRGGVSYEFGSAFGGAPENLLPTLIFPYFLRHPDAASWWSLWQPWETQLYVGVPTLALALVGVMMSRRREMLFFLVLGLLSIWIAMAHYAPLANLHELLWSIPGFSFLRAPGRFSYLVVFALAALAALGLQALHDRRARLNRAIVVGLGLAPTLALLLGLLVLMPVARAWLLDDPERALRLVESGYLSIRAQYAIEPRLVLAGLLGSLDIVASPKTTWSLCLLALTAAAFWLWHTLGAARAWLGQAAFVTLITFDLLVFAADYHPRQILEELAPTLLPGVAAGERVMVLDDGRALPEMEPNAPLWRGYRPVGGYSSLPSQRHVELASLTTDVPALRSLWAAPYVVEPIAPADAVEAGGVEFRTGFPLVGGHAGAGPRLFKLPPLEGAGLTALRVVATMAYAYELPPGEEVGHILLLDEQGQPSDRLRVPIRAGVEVAERALDRPSLAGLVRHERPAGPTALDFEEATPAGEVYSAHLYLADIPLPPGSPREVRTISIEPTHGVAFLQVYGLGLVRQDGNVRSLGLGDESGLRPVPVASQRLRLFIDPGVQPRAFLEPEANAVYRSERPSVTPVQTLAGGGGLPGFNPRVQVLVEGVEGSPSWTRGSSSPRGRPLPLEDLGPNALRLSNVSVSEPSYLVLNDFYHRGWRAWVDGREEPVRIANAAFRAVRLEPGTHTVEMRFLPWTHIAGAAISAVALLSALAILGWAFLPRPRWRRLPAATAS